MLSLRTFGGITVPKIKSLVYHRFYSVNQPVSFLCIQQRCSNLGCDEFLNRSYSTNVRMPSLSPTMSEGTIVKWHKAEGDPVQPGDLLCDIQTDKAVVSFEFDDEGVLAKVLRPDGGSGCVGDIIAIMADPGEDWRGVAADADKLTTSAATPTPSTPPSNSPSHSPSHSSSSSSTSLRVGPAAQLLLRQHRLSASAVRATGPRGTLLKSDVLSHVGSGATAASTTPSAPAAFARTVSAPSAAPTAAAAAAGPAASRPSMSPLEPRTEPLDHPVGPGLRGWAAGQVAAKLAAPHAYATAACRPWLSPSASSASPTDGDLLGALAVRALASALSAGAEAAAAAVNVGLLVLASPALPRLARLPRAQALGLREIAERASATTDDAGGPLDAIVCDLSRQGAVQLGHLMLHPDAPLLLTVGRPSVVHVESDGMEGAADLATTQQQVHLGLTVDSRLLDHTQASQLLASVAANMEQPLLALSGVASVLPSQAAGAAAPLQGSDILQLGLDD